MTPIPWEHVQVVNDDGSNLTAEQVGEYVAKTFSNGDRVEFHVIQAVKEDGKTYDVCHVGNGPDSPWNAAGIAKAINHHKRLVEVLKEVGDLEQMSMENAIGWLEDNCNDIRVLLAELEE